VPVSHSLREVIANLCAAGPLGGRVPPMRRGVRWSQIKGIRIRGWKATSYSCRCRVAKLLPSVEDKWKIAGEVTSGGRRGDMELPPAVFGVFRVRSLQGKRVTH
jgi:hypothetical protein